MPSRRKSRMLPVEQRRTTNGQPYRPQLHYFDYKSVDDLEIQRFERFIKNNLTEFFSSAEESTHRISVSDSEMRAVINLGGAFVQTLVQLSNTISMESQNHSREDGGRYNMKEYHEGLIFESILFNSNTFTQLINNIKEYLKNLSKGFFEWNVVYYSYYYDSVMDMGHQKS